MDNSNIMKSLNGYEVYDESARTGVVTTGTGAAYEATVKGITELTSGVWFIMVPHVTSTSVSPTLLVNNLKAKKMEKGNDGEYKEVEFIPTIRRRLSSSLRSTVSDEAVNWISDNNPMIVMYDASLTPPAWVVVGYEKPDVPDFYGQISTNQIKDGAVTPAKISELPKATIDTFGTVKPDGQYIILNEDGALTTAGGENTDVAAATSSTLGIVRPDNETITVDNGILTAVGGGSSSSDYVLPAASTTVLGGVQTTVGSAASGSLAFDTYVSSNKIRGVMTPSQIGSGLEVNSNKLRVKVDNSTIKADSNGILSAVSTLPIATTTTLGGVRPDGTTITVNESGVISSVGGGSTYELPVATRDTLGGVKPDGTSILVDSNGVISVEPSVSSGGMTRTQVEELLETVLSSAQLNSDGKLTFTI